MGPRRRTQARVSIVCRRPPVPHAPNELDDPFAVAVDRFGTAYIADLAGLFQRITCASPATALSRVHMPARSPESPATRKTASISPTLNTAWYRDYPPYRRQPARWLRQAWPERRSGEVRFHRHSPDHPGWRLDVVRPDARSAHSGADGEIWPLCPQPSQASPST